MELGAQVKKYRAELSLSQEALVEKVYVSRQTISNWENDKSYPDVNSLLLLSEVFQVSIDNLIKGDVEEMKEQVKEADLTGFMRLGKIFTVLLILDILTPVPLWMWLGDLGIGIWVALFSVSMYIAVLCEKQKKS